MVCVYVCLSVCVCVSSLKVELCYGMGWSGQPSN